VIGGAQEVSIVFGAGLAEDVQGPLPVFVKMTGVEGAVSLEAADRIATECEHQAVRIRAAADAAREARST
jgi:hypothetical protein